MGFGVLVILVGAGAWWGLDYLAHRPPDKEKVERHVTIPHGASLKKIAQTLEHEGLVPDWRLFAAYAVRKDVARRLQAGAYRLHTQMTMAELAEALMKGRSERLVTIPEGFTLAQTAQRLAAAGSIGGAEQFLALGADPQMRRLAGAEGPSVEGFLFPDTYFFDSSEDAQAIMERMIRAFHQRLAECLTSPTICMGRSVSLYEIVTLASMIQREARNAQEMPLIASVYYNRLAQGMKLECDATVRYALGVWDRSLAYADLKVDSPYNTYRHPGLPPGPICNPGAEALSAAAHPAQSDYLFYVYRGDGGHEFTHTYGEHLAASEKFIKPIKRASEIKRRPTP